MKRNFSLFLILCIVFSFLAGCDRMPTFQTPNTVPADNYATPVFRVSTVDEFLDALGSHRTIILEPGIYVLSDATGYGATETNGSYLWTDHGDGYELTLTNLRELTILGDGMGKTIFETAPRYIEVLTLENCANITLKDFTAGHTEMEDDCIGGVIRLDNCAVINLDGLGLFGCGTVGISGYSSYSLSVKGCEIYECTSSGIELYECSDVDIRDTQISSIGDDFSGWSILSLADTDRVSITNCRASLSSVPFILDIYGSKDVVIRDTAFEQSYISDSAFGVAESSVTMDNCIFADNMVNAWYSAFGDSLILDAEGNFLTEDYFVIMNDGADPDATDPSEPAGPTEPEETVSLPQREIVNVATVDEFLAAIGPNREIVLTGAEYNLSTASNYGKSGGAYYYWYNEFDGPELVITAVENMVIRSDDGNVTGHTICSVPRYADVLTFDNCSYIEISGFTAGHTLLPGSCAGGVIDVLSSNHITISNCGLFGCGIFGVTSTGSHNLTVQDCDIYECSEGGMWLSCTTEIVIDNCTFRDLGGSTMYFYECANITVDGKQLPTRSDIEIP